MTASAGSPFLRSWPRAAGLAALTLWLPALAPFVLGPLRECSHCIRTYAICLPIVPGVIVPIATGLDDAWFFVGGAATALVLVSVLVVVLREMPRPWATGIQVVVALGVAAEALGFAALLRM